MNLVSIRICIAPSIASSFASAISLRRRILRRGDLATILLVSLLPTLPPVFAEPDSKAKELKKRDDEIVGAERHDAYFIRESAHTLQLLARQHLRRHDYRRALPLIERALKLDNDDVELHVLYAHALQEKFEAMEDPDPRLFNKIVKIWLMVMRNEVGMEKGTSYKGISIENGAYGDEEIVLRAKNELKHLTGCVPKMWETDDHYLKRVLKVARTSVTAKIRLKPSSQGGEAASENNRPPAQESKQK